jgi:small-conductance mechanosensitive channel
VSTFTLSELLYLLAIGFTFLLIVMGLRVVQYLLARLPYVQDVHIPMVARLLLKPFRVLLAILGVQLAWRWFDADRYSWGHFIDQALQIALIIATTWMAITLVRSLELAIVDRYANSENPGDVAVRRSITQMSLMRRLIVAGIVTIAAAMALMTFSSFRTISAGLLASAGIISIVVGIAAQSTLGNVFAGLHLAFSNIIKVDDIVVVAGESGQVDEVTLTTVVVHIWNDRRLILPTSYFKEHPFENWTRNGPEIGGDIFLDVGFTAPVADMRAELLRYLPTNSLWDGRQGVLWVSDVSGGRMRIRIAVTTANTDDLWGLLNDVREHMAGYLVRTSPQSVLQFRGDGVYPA